MHCAVKNFRRLVTPYLGTAMRSFLIASILFTTVAAYAQDVSEEKFNEAMTAPATATAPTEPAAQSPLTDPSTSQMNLLKMASPNVGGPFMYPIYIFSFIVLLFIFERAIGLRRAKIIPSGLVEAFGGLAGGQTGFDPRKAYKICQQFPSTASNVIRAMLLKIGRPHSEVEAAVTQANEREAAKLYSNIRPLNLAATTAPLLGLLGTVQGMIIAFYVTANLPDGANKAQKLAEGVYVALVTTFAGLCVAIPAVIASHYFEGKIQKRFRDIDELVSTLLPQLERFEGKLRVSRHQLAGHDTKPDGKPEPNPIPIAEQPV